MSRTSTPRYSKELDDLIMNSDEGPWIDHTKIALEWLLSYIEIEEWEARKENVVKYFRAQEESIFKNYSEAAKGYEDPKNRVAFHEDWVAWYLFLVECLHDHPMVSEQAQSARVFPFFAAIGRHIEIAKK